MAVVLVKTYRILLKYLPLTLEIDGSILAFSDIETSFGKPVSYRMIEAV